MLEAIPNGWRVGLGSHAARVTITPSGKVAFYVVAITNEPAISFSVDALTLAQAKNLSLALERVVELERAGIFDVAMIRDGLDAVETGE